MISVGQQAPGFELPDHFDRVIDLDRFTGKRHVMLLFYPLDFTPTWSREVPEVEHLLPRFRAAHTQVLGISVDSIFCHANWGRSLGGISFPLLADFHPKGSVAGSYGLYLEDKGITDRATVIIDAGGTVRHASSVTPAGRRNIEEPAGLCESIDAEYGTGLSDFPLPEGIGKVHALFVKSNCGFSRKAMLARENLHLQDELPLRNVTEDPQAREELVRLSGKDQAPCLMIENNPIQESDEIVRYLVRSATDLE